MHNTNLPNDLEQTLSMLTDRLKFLERMIGVPEGMGDEEFVSLFEGLKKENEHLRQVMKRAAVFIEANWDLLCYERGFPELELYQYLAGVKAVNSENEPYPETKP